MNYDTAQCQCSVKARKVNVVINEEQGGLKILCMTGIKPIAESYTGQ